MADATIHEQQTKTSPDSPDSTSDSTRSPSPAAPQPQPQPRPKQQDRPVARMPLAPVNNGSHSARTSGFSTSTPKSSRPSLLRKQPTIGKPIIGRAKQFVPQHINARSCYDVYSQEGLHMSIPMLWHLQLSPKKHAYLSRMEGKVSFHIWEFGLTERGDQLYPDKGVMMDKQQLRDFMFALLELRAVVLRTDDLRMKRLHIAEIEEDEDGKIDSFTPEQMESIRHLLVAAPRELKIHIGKLMYAHAKAHYKSICLRQNYFREVDKEGTPLEKPIECPLISKGILLNKDEVLGLIDGIWTIPSRWRGVEDLKWCIMTHTTEDEIASCNHCSPGGRVNTALPPSHPLAGKLSADAANAAEGEAPLRASVNHASNSTAPRSTASVPLASNNDRDGSLDALSASIDGMLATVRQFAPLESAPLKSAPLRSAPPQKCPSQKCPSQKCQEPAARL